ncbi:MAG: hydrogenase iron-sulfur subunit [Deltaproteobacteria bacterium]|nr:hydrogenase iron-sulfur subunit [Deltaproteobacteria bacterium]
MSAEETARFEPRIVAFCCNWCSYAGADLAGGMRLKYRPNLVPIRVMCSARVAPQFIIRAFQEGADGVLVAGCHIGDCHYVKGNFITAKRVAILRRLIEFMGIPRERLRLEWIAASEGDKYARVADAFTEEIRALGPSPIKDIRFGERSRSCASC